MPVSCQRHMPFAITKSKVSMLLLSSAVSASAVDFTREVRPILVTKCYACHGPDENKREEDLRLDAREEAIKPGKPDESEVWKRFSSNDKDEVMPPPTSPKPLTDAEREILRHWIAEGAEYQQHWAFLQVRRPEVPGNSGFQPSRALRIRPSLNPIDTFIIEQSRRFASRLLQSGTESEKRIAAAYRDALGRDATAAELQRGLDFIREADSMLVSTRSDHSRRELDTWAAFCQPLLASNELRYVD